MNEQIHELAEQARVQDRGYFIYQYGGPSGHQSVEKAIDLEKFAELIVRESISVVNKRFMGDLNREDMEVKRCVEDLKKHFGVE